MSFMPTAKVLVITVVLMGAGLGLQEFRYLDYYKEMIREDKHAFAREILERGFAVGAVIGAIGYGAINLTDNIRLSLLLFTVIMIVLLFVYPLITLLYTTNHPNGSSHGSSGKDTQSPFEGFQDTVDYGSRQQQDSSQIFYGQDRYSTYGHDNSEEGESK